MESAKIDSTPAQVQARQAPLGQPAVVAVAAATLDRFFQPDTGKCQGLNTLEADCVCDDSIIVVLKCPAGHVAPLVGMLLMLNVHAVIHKRTRALAEMAFSIDLHPHSMIHLAGASEALRWLRSIWWGLSSASSKGDQLSEVTLFTLCTLLEHSAASVKKAAAETMAAAAKAVPVCGISFLPVLVHHLQRMAAETPDFGTSPIRLTASCHRSGGQARNLLLFTV